MISENLLLRAFGADLDLLKPHLVSTHLKAGQVLKREGEAIEHVYFPTAGLISSRIALQSGHEIECSLIGRTNAVGAVGAMGLDRADSSRFVCLTDAHAWRVSLAQLTSLATVNTGLRRELLYFGFAQLGYAVHVGVCNALHSAEQRLARWLATAADLLGSPEIRLPQEELAHILGLQRSAVNPALQRLKADGLLEVARGRIHILDLERMNRRACECHVRLRSALLIDGAGARGASIPSPREKFASTQF